ncbi:hypothetical protein [Flagellimonas sp.]|uniref:hypothetical protein n=1 Tax=Flagellimonas sp. TaxID=2058762 RepID=UPI003BAC05D9
MNMRLLNKFHLPFLLLLLSCQNESSSEQASSVIENGTDWESKNLYGKVKSITLYKATYLDSKGKKTREPIKTFSEEFTEFGSIKKTEYFDDLGLLSQSTVNEFDENEFLVKSTTINENEYRPFKSITTIEHDTIENLIIRNSSLNDSLNFKYIEEYNAKGRLIKNTSIENGDTVVWTSKQEYNKNNKIVLEEVSPSNEEESQIFKYEYDSLGNVIESINGNKWMKFKTISKYKGSHLVLDSTYNIGADEKEHLSQIIAYDTFSNPISIKIYENSELNRELKNSYKLDRKGNWIKKTVSMKEHFADSKIFTPAYVETREIEYWK